MKNCLALGSSISGVRIRRRINGDGLVKNGLKGDVEAEWGEGLSEELHHLVTVHKVTTNISILPQPNLLLLDSCVQRLSERLRVESVHLFGDPPLGLEIRERGRSFNCSPLRSWERGRNEAKASCVVKSSRKGVAKNKVEPLSQGSVLTIRQRSIGNRGSSRASLSCCVCSLGCCALRDGRLFCF